MQGVTRDTAMAQALWRPKSEPVTEASVPDRDDPGDIASPEGRQRSDTERPSGNKRAKKKAVRLY